MAKRKTRTPITPRTVSSKASSKRVAPKKKAAKKKAAKKKAAKKKVSGGLVQRGFRRLTDAEIQHNFEILRQTHNTNADQVVAINETLETISAKLNKLVSEYHEQKRLSQKLLDSYSRLENGAMGANQDQCDWIDRTHKQVNENTGDLERHRTWMKSHDNDIRDMREAIELLKAQNLGRQKAKISFELGD